MANPLQFEPKKVDPRKELELRLAAAPLQHAEALLVAFDVLEEAHNQGLLDMLHGAIGSKDAIFGKLAEYASQPISTQAMRNVLLLLKLVGSIDPEVLDTVVKNLARTSAPPQKPPTLWQIFKRIRSEDGRRGLAVVTGLLTALGRTK